MRKNIVEKIEKAYPVKVVYGDTESCLIWHKAFIGALLMLLENLIC